MRLTNKQAQLVAYREALKAHREFEVDPHKPVDVHSVLRKAGIIVMLQPLGNLAGAYIPPTARSKSRPGVILNSSHPWAKQRYTAAHELCHHLRDSTPELDTMPENDWEAKVQHEDRERIAEAFASWFLMPRDLVNDGIKRMIQAGGITAERILALSQFLGVSYAAMVMHLYTLGKLSRAEVDGFRKLKPSELKRQLGAGLGSTPWNDTWVLNLDYHQSSLQMRVGDEIQIVVPETPSTGYEWLGGDAADRTDLELL